MPLLFFPISSPLFLFFFLSLILLLLILYPVLFLVLFLPSSISYIMIQSMHWCIGNLVSDEYRIVSDGAWGFGVGQGMISTMMEGKKEALSWIGCSLWTGGCKFAVSMARHKFNEWAIEFDNLSMIRIQERERRQGANREQENEPNEEVEMNEVNNEHHSHRIELAENQDRLQTLKRSHQYVLGLLMLYLLLFVSSLSLLFFVPDFSITFLLLLLAQPFLLCIEMVHIIAKYLFQLVFWETVSEWDDRASKYYFFDAVTDFILNTIKLLHFLHIFYVYGIRFSFADIFVLVNFRNAWLGISKAYTALASYRSALEELQSLLADVSAEDLKKLNDSCAICISELDNPSVCKKLPCQHIFHISCLRQWFRHKRICPNCRTHILPEESLAEVRNQNVPARPVQNDAASSNADQHAFPHLMNNGLLQEQVYRFDSASFASWLPHFTFEYRQGNLSRIPNRNFPFRNSAVNIASNMMESNIRAVQDIFPDFPIDSIEADLRQTGAATLTIERILNGQVIAQNLANVQQSSSQHVVPAEQAVFMHQNEARDASADLPSSNAARFTQDAEILRNRTINARRCG